MDMLDPRDLILGLLSLVGLYFWSDKQRLEKKVDALEHVAAQQSAKHDVLETKIDGLKELLTTKFDMILTAIKDDNK